MGVKIGDFRYQFTWAQPGLVAGDREKIEVGQYSDVDINFCFSRPVGAVSYRGKDYGVETYRLECVATKTLLYRIGDGPGSKVLLASGRPLAPGEMVQIRLRGIEHSLVVVDAANAVQETILGPVADGTYGAEDDDPDLPGNLDGSGLRLFIVCLSDSCSSMGQFVPR